jgi:hypothetical protein
MQSRNHGSRRKKIEKRNCKLPPPQGAKPGNLNPACSPKTDSPSMSYPLFTDDLPGDFAAGSGHLALPPGHPIPIFMGGGCLYGSTGFRRCPIPVDPDQDPPGASYEEPHDDVPIAPQGRSG